MVVINDAERIFVVVLFDGMMIGGAENSRTEFPSEALRFTRTQALSIALRHIGSQVIEARHPLGCYDEENLVSDEDFIKTVAW